MKVRSDQFSRLSRAALQDEFLREALARANASFQDARGDAIDSMPDWEELRQQAHEIKNRAIENLPEALEPLEDVMLAGARDAISIYYPDAARRLVLRARFWPSPLLAGHLHAPVEAGESARPVARCAACAAPPPRLARKSPTSAGSSAAP